MIQAWVFSKLEPVKDDPMVVVRDPLGLTEGMENALHAWGKTHTYAVIPCATNLLFRYKYEEARADETIKKILILDRTPLSRRTRPDYHRAAAPFYPDILAQTRPEACIELDLRQFLREQTNDAYWPQEVNEPRLARLLMKYLDGALRAHENLRAASPDRFTDQDLKTIIAFAALGVPEAAFKNLSASEYWKIGLRGHHELRGLEQLMPEITETITGKLKKAPAPFCWLADKYDPDTVIRAFYLSVVLAQHVTHWQTLPANVDPIFGRMGGIAPETLQDAAPKLVSLDPARAQSDIRAMEDKLTVKNLHFLLLEQMQIEARFAEVIEKEQYSELFRSLSLILALDNLCSTHPTQEAQKRVSEALLAKRSQRALVDLRPSATWKILRQAYLRAVRLLALRGQLGKFVKELDQLPETTQVLYLAPGQEKTVAFHVKPDISLATNSERASGEMPWALRVCPVCYERGLIEEISTRSEKFGSIPVLVSYICENGCQPQSGERLHNDPDDKKREYFKKYDVGKLAEIEEMEIPYWYPRNRMMNAPEDQECWGVKWRAGTSNFRTVDELFTKRNLWALAVLFNAASQEQTSDVLRFRLEAILLNLSRMQGNTTDPRFPNNIIRGTYYTPQIMREYSVLPWYAGKIRNLIDGYSKLYPSYQGFGEVCISTQSACSMDAIPDNSLDYIFTDPPYGDKVQYGELNFVWESWMGWNTLWHDDEIIINDVRGKTELDWSEMMECVIKECYRVLKPGRWLTLCYHDTSEGTWALVQDLMKNAGFIVDVSGSTLFIETEQKSFNQLTADIEEMFFMAHRISALTHRHPRSQMACGLYCIMAKGLLYGLTPGEAYRFMVEQGHRCYNVTPFQQEMSHFARILSGELIGMPINEIASSGYVIHTLEASLWCLLTTGSFEDAVLTAVNLGDDTDTTGCVAGGLAGVSYGDHAINATWLSVIVRSSDMRALSQHFLAVIPQEIGIGV
jgi:hypothetical protein